MSYTYARNYKNRIQRPLTKFEEDFCDWIDKVEKLVFDKISISLLDLDDELYMVNFEQGLSSCEMSKIIIEHYQENYDEYDSM
jgi:hypothetical protein